MSLYSRPLAARKAKYGWDMGGLHLRMVIDFAEFMKALQTNFTDKVYVFETVGLHNSDLRLYTDDDTCAEWIRGYFASHKPQT